MVVSLPHLLSLNLAFRIMKKSLSLLLVIFVTSNAVAQIQDQSTRRYFTSINTTSVELVTTFNNGYAVVGYSDDFNSTYRVPFVLMADSIGQTLWQRHYSDLTNGFQFNRIIQLPDSSLVAVGKMRNQLQNANGAALLKLDKNGNEIWKKSIESVGIDCIANDVIMSADTNLLVVGSAGNGSFIFKMDLNGNEISGKKLDLQINPNNLSMSIKAVVEGPGSQKYFAGTINNEGFLCSLDSTDSVLFLKRFSDSNFSFSFSDLCLENDGILIRDDATNSDLIKTDFNGNFVWAKNYTNEYDWFPNQGPRKMLHLTNGNYLIYASDMAIGNLVSVDSQGNPQSGLMFLGRVKSVKQDENGRLFVLVNGPGYGVKSLMTQEHFAVTRLDSLNSSNSGCMWNGAYNNVTTTFLSNDDSLVLSDSIQINDALMELFTVILSEDNACVDFMGGVDEINEFKFKLVPNPAHDFLSINFENLTNSNTLELLDLRGVSLLTKKIDFNNTKIDISNLSNGVYIIRIGQVVERFIKD